MLLPSLLRLLVNVAAAHVDMQLLEQLSDKFSYVLDVRPSREQLATIASSDTVVFSLLFLLFFRRGKVSCSREVVTVS